MKTHSVDEAGAICEKYGIYSDIKLAVINLHVINKVSIYRIIRAIKLVYLKFPNGIICDFLHYSTDYSKCKLEPTMMYESKTYDLETFGIESMLPVHTTKHPALGKSKRRWR